MGRYYQMSKTVTKDQEKEILKEIRELDNVKHAELKDKRTSLLIETKDGEYTQVMDVVVNIFKRLGDGCELHFLRFDEK